MTRVIYTAYGTATEMGEDWTGAGDEYAFDGPLYCGYWHDTETGLSQTQNRYYNPNLSTWINRDPIGYGGGNNLYGYVGDDPTDETRNTGLAHLPADWRGTWIEGTRGMEFPVLRHPGEPCEGRGWPEGGIRERAYRNRLDFQRKPITGAVPPPRALTLTW